MGAQNTACYPRLMRFRLAASSVALVLFLTGCVASVGNYFAPTAALVNGSKVAESNISSELRRVLKNEEFARLFQGPQGDQSRRDAQREVLTRLIREQVIVTEATRLGVSIGEDEVSERYKAIKSGFGSEAAFVAERKRQGFTEQDVLDFLRKQLLVERVQAEVTKSVTVSQDDVSRAYEERKAEFDAQIHAAHILICSQFDAKSRTCTESPSDAEEANQVANRARAGEDFAALARQFSRDSSTTANGGDLGWLTRERLVQAFADTAFALNPGDISNPVKSQFGHHVIKLVAKGRPFEEAKPELEQQLLDPLKQREFTSWLAQAVKRAVIRVNPKFGRFDRSSQSVVPAAPEPELSVVPGRESVGGP